MTGVFLLTSLNKGNADNHPKHYIRNLVAMVTKLCILGSFGHILHVYLINPPLFQEIWHYYMYYLLYHSNTHLWQNLPIVWYWWSKDERRLDISWLYFHSNQLCCLIATCLIKYWGTCAPIRGFMSWGSILYSWSYSIKLLTGTCTKRKATFIIYLEVVTMATILKHSLFNSMHFVFMIVNS